MKIDSKGSNGIIAYLLNYDNVDLSKLQSYLVSKQFIPGYRNISVGKNTVQLNGMLKDELFVTYNPPQIIFDIKNSHLTSAIFENICNILKNLNIQPNDIGLSSLSFNVRVNLEKNFEGIPSINNTSKIIEVYNLLGIQGKVAGISIIDKQNTSNENFGILVNLASPKPVTQKNNDMMMIIKITTNDSHKFTNLTESLLNNIPLNIMEQLTQ